MVINPSWHWLLGHHACLCYRSTQARGMQMTECCPALQEQAQQLGRILKRGQEQEEELLR